MFNWRFYKLLYSHFWGYQVKTSLFANPDMYVKLNKVWLIFNCLATYLPLIIFDIVGLADLDWGNQLYISLIETLVLSIVMAGVGIYEVCMVKGYLAKDGSSKENMERAMKVMSGFDDENDMTKDKLLKKQKFATAYIDRKLDELVKMFGKRRCKSEEVFGSTKESDPRQIYTWPMSPHIALPHVDDPPLPFPDDYPNNCYNQPKSPRWLKKNGKLGTDCFNKGIQCGGMENDRHRLDAGLISLGDKDFTTGRSTDKKKIRGRKNRYFQQIDNEDHDAGAALDSDEEGKIANEIAKREHIERMAQLEAIREEDEELEKRRQEREKRRLAARKREEELAAENQRLREILAKERSEDDRIASQFKQQLQDEEKRRRELLNSHKNDMAKLEKEKALNMKSKFEIDQKNERD